MRRAKPHRLPGSLTVTLTSYPPRYRTLSLTLKSLLAQSIRPDLVCLWIAQADFATLPANVLSLQREGMVIRVCDDLRSYKKVIPALLDGDQGFLVTADDDQYYRHDWLRELVTAYRPGKKEVICGRARRIRMDSDGKPLPYSQWENNVRASEPEVLVFPAGLGGVLYAPGIFHADVCRVDIFESLCPTADDVWLYWMAALNGAKFRKVGPRHRQIAWARSQRVALYALNRTANDVQIGNAISRYGFPGARSGGSAQAMTARSGKSRV